MAASDDSVPILSSETLSELESLQMEGEPDIVLEIFGTFANSAADRLAGLDRLAKAATLKELSKEAHAFKSSSRTVGALRLGNLCQALESQPENGLGPEKLLEKIRAETTVVLAEMKKIRPALQKSERT